jgi:hypothetical protein
MSAIICPQLLEIIIKGSPDRFYFQQYQLDDLEYLGKTYKYLAFDIQPAGQSLDVDSSQSGQLRIAYTALAESAIEENDGLRGSTLIHSYFLGGFAGRAVIERYQIESTATNDQESAIFITLGNPLTAINARIPGALITKSVFGELPIRNSIGL